MREQIASATGRRLDADGQRRAETHLHLVEALAWDQFRLSGPTVPLDELIGEAHFALAYAASLFDPTKGVPFGAYATLVIRHRLVQVVTFWRRGGRLDHVRFTDLAHVDSAGTTSTFDPMCPRTREASWEAAIREQVGLVRKCLPHRWFQVIQLHYSDGFTLEEVSHLLEISRERVRQLLAKAVERVRLRLSVGSPEEARLWPRAHAPSTDANCSDRLGQCRLMKRGKVGTRDKVSRSGTRLQSIA